jgi:alkylresorcinol/alkylpyrone synthase
MHAAVVIFACTPTLAFRGRLMTARAIKSLSQTLEPAERDMLTRPALRLRFQPHPTDTEREIEITAQRRPVSLNVGIASIATAVPAYKISQQEVTKRAMRLFPHLAQRGSLYSNTGIDTRYACMPPDWYHQRRSWEERSAAFNKHAIDLLAEVACKATARAGLQIKDIDAIVLNTITGVAVPSLDALLMNRLDFRNDVERLPIFGFGCGGGVAGLARAAQLARAGPGTNVLFLSVDLCSLCLRTEDDSVTMFVATALFGDGAAGMVLRDADGTGANGHAARASIEATGEHFWRETEHIMGWDIKDDGFGVVLSPDLTVLLRARLAAALSAFLQRQHLTLADFDGFLFHPGGRKVLHCLQDVLPLKPSDLAHSWSVLKDYGNMSSATALFVLERALASGAKGRHLLGAFGPGFSAYFAILDL